MATGLPLQAQEVNPAIRQELERRGLTVEEARREAARLGIDLSDPVQAAARARELGVSEAQIQSWLALEEEAAQFRADSTGLGSQDRLAPVLSGLAVWSPSEVVFPPRARTDRMDTVRVRVPLRDDLSGIRQVNLFLIDSLRADTLTALEVRRVLGSPLDGVWQGLFELTPAQATAVWSLLVEVTDQRGLDNLIMPEERLVVRREGEALTDEGAVADEEDEGLAFFGYELFKQAFPGGIDQPLAGASDSYLVGPGDELRLAVWGGTEFQYTLTVDAEGRVFVPGVGQRLVGGTRLDALRRDMERWLSQNYAGLMGDPPTIFMDLSLTRLRPVQVLVMGEVERAGLHTIPSNATVFDALYAVVGVR
ncbi:MAG: polysaccharide biosynthesis/export family protein, partial [Bacteroidota bacterium]